MPVRFVSRSGKFPPTQVDSYQKLNLLGHAQLEELEIGSRCGGHGVCGGDRVLVRAAAQGGDRPAVSPLTDAERRHLTPAQISEGFRLGCQCFVDDVDALITVEAE